MARRLGDRAALGYALNARMHALWGIEPAPERLATGTELGEIADDIGDELLALHGHMWRIRELLAQGDVDAVNEEIARFRARDTGPVHPLEASFVFNVAAMMALLAGDVEAGGAARPAGHGGGGGPQRAGTELLRGAHDVDLVAARRAGRHLTSPFREVIDQAPSCTPPLSASLALVPCRGGRDRGGAASARGALAASDWENVADDQTEGVSLALAAAACSVIGAAGRALRRAGVRGDAALRRHRRSWSVRRLRRAWARPTTISVSWRDAWATSPWPRCTTRRRFGWPAAWSPRRSSRRPRWSWPARCARRRPEGGRGAGGRAPAQRRGVRAAPRVCTGWRNWPPNPG